MLTQQCKQKLKLNHLSRLILHLGTFHWQTISGGRHLGALGSLPRYLLTTISWLTVFLCLQTLSMMCNYTVFVKDPSQWEETYQVLWWGHNICTLLTQFQVTQITWSELSTLSHTEAWGDAEKFWNNLAFLLIAPERTEGERWCFGLAMVWVHPYQACTSSLDEVAKKLILFTTSSRNWAYAFGQFNKDAQHVHLPRKGHLSTMIDGTPRKNMYRCLGLLEVDQLLQSEDQVVYP